MDIGRVCVKIKGREAGKKAVVVAIEKESVLIDGPDVRRRKCNKRHLFPTKEKIKINKNTPHSAIVKLMEIKISKGNLKNFKSKI